MQKKPSIEHFFKNQLLETTVTIVTIVNNNMKTTLRTIVTPPNS